MHFLDSIRDQLLPLLFRLPGLLAALTIHEFSHALMSTWLGDPLPAQRGRLSLNPFHHLDPVGAVMLLLVGFGWAKPVYVDPRHYKRPRLGMSLVALAGPVSNLLLAFLFCIILTVLSAFPLTGKLLFIVYQLVLYGMLINIGLAIFNLLPLPPLDGSKVLFSFLPPKAYNKFLRLEQYGMILLIVFLLDIPGRILSYLSVPAHIAMWFDLTTYLTAAQGAVINAFLSVIHGVIGLFGG